MNDEISSASPRRAGSMWLSGSLLLVLIALAVGGYEIIQWTVNRVYVYEGYSLLLRYKGPPLPFLPGGRKPAQAGQFAKTDEAGRPLEIGVLKEMKGPGRHFLWYGWWETQMVPDTLINPGEVAVVTSKMGNDLPKEQFLVEGVLGETEYKGIMRRVLGPGNYRINPYAYESKVVKLETIDSNGQQKLAGWVSIPTGSVGVVTNLAPNPETGVRPGISNAVLPPGLYPINPKEQHIDVVEIGYREISIKTDVLVDAQGNTLLDESGEPRIPDNNSGITFASNDGFPIHMDFTAVWGVMPEQAPEVIRKFGNVKAVETKVVVPQIESICRNMGAKLGAVDLLVGTSRLKFQSDSSESFSHILQDKGLTLLYGLVRHIYIPQVVRLPIQQSFIADELKKTRQQEQLTARTEAMLREAEQKVTLEGKRVVVETDKLVAEAIAEGKKQSEETKAGTAKLIAAIDRQTAELEAQANILLGEAEAKVKQLSAEATSEKFVLAVEAFGSGTAYNQWVFANGLPDDIKLNLLYAGDGTFWTDLKGFTDTMLSKQVRETQTPVPAPNNRTQPGQQR